LLKIYANYNYSYQSSNAITNTMIKNKNNNYLSISSIYMGGFGGKKRDLGKTLLRQATMDFVPRISYIFLFFYFFIFSHVTEQILI
jgi:hypothetical protein